MLVDIVHYIPQWGILVAIITTALPSCVGGACRNSLGIEQGPRFIILITMPLFASKPHIQKGSKLYKVAQSERETSYVDVRPRILPATTCSILSLNGRCELHLSAIVLLIVTSFMRHLCLWRLKCYRSIQRSVMEQLKECMYYNIFVADVIQKMPVKAKGVPGCQPGIWGHPGYHFIDRTDTLL